MCECRESFGEKEKRERERRLSLFNLWGLLNVFLSFHIILLKIKVVKYLEGFYYVFEGVSVIFFFNFQF